MNIRRLFKTVLKNECIWCLLAGFVLLAKTSIAQVLYQPYSYQFYQKLNKTVYSDSTAFHTSVKPYLIPDSSIIRSVYDSLLLRNVDNSQKSWLNHVLFSGHLAEVKKRDFTFYLDYLPDAQLGREFSEHKSVWLNTRGYQLGGTIGAKFFFYSSGYENQGAFPNYEMHYIRTIGMIPGQAYNRAIYGLHTDWSYVTSLIGYQPSKAFTIELGEDKTFIGDGYRSVLLSDYAGAYPLLRLTADLGKKVRYMAMWTYMEDRTAFQFNAFFNNRRKWAAIHYIDWNVTHKLSVGFFNALIAEEANDQGRLHGFDINYINPVFFISGAGPSGTLRDHTLFGFNGKYKLLNKTTIYGQVLIDQGPSDGVSNKRNAWQAGFRGSDLFHINRLNYLFEYNTALPYTYATSAPIVNYANLNEPLAHPFGSNFKEWLGILNYSYNRFDLQGQINYSRLGLNTTSINYGSDITQPDIVRLPPTYNGTGQGLLTSIKYLEGTIAYLLNPKYNLRLEVGGLFRKQINSEARINTTMLVLGLRSSFRNLYHDF